MTSRGSKKHDRATKSGRAVRKHIRNQIAEYGLRHGIKDLRSIRKSVAK
ncbi:hypothetical protein KAW18_02525 [candidate division WOR-3 bacterium]|nr:hypothetical protein [candidate division WOR-3 bacterium]